MYVSMDGVIVIAKIVVARESAHMGSKSITANNAVAKASALMGPSGKFASLDVEAQVSVYMESRSMFAKSVVVKESAFIELSENIARWGAEDLPYVSMV